MREVQAVDGIVPEDVGGGSGEVAAEVDGTALHRQLADRLLWGTLMRMEGQVEKTIWTHSHMDIPVHICVYLGNI